MLKTGARLPEEYKTNTTIQVHTALYVLYMDSIHSAVSAFSTFEFSAHLLRFARILRILRIESRSTQVSESVYSSQSAGCAIISETV